MDLPCAFLECARALHITLLFSPLFLPYASFLRHFQLMYCTPPPTLQQTFSCNTLSKQYLLNSTFFFSFNLKVKKNLI